MIDRAVNTIAEMFAGFLAGLLVICLAVLALNALFVLGQLSGAALRFIGVYP
ncbi:hypothetical protein [Paracoccus homiensis]|uniref:Uncharacterized protein n=1 Tax=Paracoccus homiensis TaxID=364199 RepID=A0A1I0J2G4_9RHOB|nr:hypothetical protein [Paracoccus homiensis]SEU03693.1 hypothetical protein SAMN04489858_12085 [Paracoccus homiensis]